MGKLKDAGLIFCLFIVLVVIFKSYFRAGEVGRFFGALAGTPLLVQVFNRLVPKRIKREAQRSTAAFSRRAEPLPRPTEEALVLRMGGPRRHAGIRTPRAKS
jgi:hypothetical protein